MTIELEALATHLDEQFSALAAAVGQDSDPLTGYQPDIDNALRRLGRAESALGTAVNEGDRDAVYALVEYYALRRFWRLLGDRVNHSMGQTSYNFAHQLNHVKAMMDDAAQACLSYGYNVTGAGWTMGYLNLDWVEAEETNA